MACYEDGTPASNDLETHIGTIPWDEDSLIPTIVAFRRSLLAASNKNPTARNAARSIIALSKKTEVYSLVTQLDSDLDPIDDTPLCKATSIASLDTALTPFYGLLPKAIRELSNLNVPIQHVNVLLAYAQATTPAHRIGVVATMVLLAAILTKP